MWKDFFGYYDVYDVFNEKLDCLFLTRDSLDMNPSTIKYFKIFLKAHTDDDFSVSKKEIESLIQSNFYFGATKLITKFNKRLYLFVVDF